MPRTQIYQDFWGLIENTHLREMSQGVSKLIFHLFLMLLEVASETWVNIMLILSPSLSSLLYLDTEFLSSEEKSSGKGIQIFLVATYQIGMISFI